MEQCTRLCRYTQKTSDFTSTFSSSAPVSWFRTFRSSAGSAPSGGSAAPSGGSEPSGLQLPQHLQVVQQHLQLVQNLQVFTIQQHRQVVQQHLQVFSSTFSWFTFSTSPFTPTGRCRPAVERTLPRSVEAEFVSHHTYKSLTVNSVLISVKLGVEVCESRLAHTGTGCHAAGDDDDALAVGAERAMLGARDGRSAQPARNYVVAEQPENGMRR
jgi:hypothetical protein